MIKLYRSKKEVRRRDKKRCRFILQIGKKRFHVTEREMVQVYLQIVKKVTFPINWNKGKRRRT